MARVERRPRRDGGVSFRVQWREGGTRTGRVYSKTFRSASAAALFADLVREAGEHWPESEPVTGSGRPRRRPARRPIRAAAVPTAPVVAAPTGQRVFTIAEAARRIGMSKSWLAHRVAEGSVPHSRPGGSRRVVFTEAHIAAILDGAR